LKLLIFIGVLNSMIRYWNHEKSYYFCNNHSTRTFFKA